MGIDERTVILFLKCPTLQYPKLIGDDYGIDWNSDFQIVAQDELR